MTSLVATVRREWPLAAAAAGAAINSEAMLLAADSALYEAKRSGRNRVVLAP